MSSFLTTRHPSESGDSSRGVPIVRVREALRPSRTRPRFGTFRDVGLEDRFSRAAGRIAEYFCSRDDVHSFCLRVAADVAEEMSARHGWIVRAEPDTRRVETLAHHGEPGDDEAWREAVSAVTPLFQSEVPFEQAQTARRDRSVAVALRKGPALFGALCLHLERPEPLNDIAQIFLVRVARLLSTYLGPSLSLPEAEAEARRVLGESLADGGSTQGIVGRSSSLVQVLERVARVAPTNATVLIEGENGTGKELVARAIHRASRRADKPWVVVNCAAIPEQLLESELFGHERGAFTGAFERKAGRFEQADGGTVFLDEIGEMHLSLQAKLLRLLQEKTVQRLGSGRDVPVDVRFIAASNRNLTEMKERGEFREDLYWRLHVVPILVPPLRDRLEDVRPLVAHFARRYAEELGIEPPRIDPSVVDCFERYSWPGNVRELQHLIQRLVILSTDGRITRADVPLALRGTDRVERVEGTGPFEALLRSVPETYDDLQDRRRDLLEVANHLAKKLEDDFVDDLLRRHQGNKSQAAAASGMHRTLIHRNLSRRRRGAAR